MITIKLSVITIILAIMCLPTGRLYAAPSVDMASHIGQKVTVTGKYAITAQPGATKTASRTAEERLDVSKLKFVGSTCP